MSAFIEGLVAKLQGVLIGLQGAGSAAYWLVALIVLAETIVVIGQFVPGSLFLAFVGFLCHEGYFGLWEMVGTAVSTHIIGEHVNYALGRSRGRGLFREESRFFKPAHLARVERQFNQSPIRILVLGQFFGVIRPIIALAAGTARLPLVRFTPGISLGSVLWASIPLVAGYFAGSGWQQAVHRLEGLTLLIVVGVPLALLAGWLLRWLVRHGGAVGRAAERLSRRAHQSPSYQNLARRSPRVFAWVEARLSLSRRWGLRATLGLELVALCAALFAACLAQVHSTAGRMLVLDHNVVNLLYQLRRPATDQILVPLTHLATTPVVLVFLAALLPWLVWGRRQLLSAHIIGGAAALAMVGSFLAKTAFARARPDSISTLVSSAGSSFPSSHAAISAAVFLGLYYWMWNQPGRLRAKAALSALLLVLGLLVGFSRLYLGVHFPTDVAGGYLLGLASAVLAIVLATNRRTPPQDAPLRADWPLTAALVALAAIAFGWSLTFGRHPEQAPPQVKASAFRSFATLAPIIPRQSTSLTGRAMLPTNIVLTGTSAPLVSTLLGQGWRAVRPDAFYTRQIASPVAPSFVEGQPAELTLRRDSTDDRLVLRLWRLAESIPAETSAPVYIGSVAHERKRPSLLFLELHSLLPDVDAALDSLTSDTRAAGPALAAEPLPRFRERGLYNWQKPWFTHGGAVRLRQR